MRQNIDKAEREAQAKSDTTLDELRGKVAHLSGKLQRLLDSFLDELIDRQTYLANKAELMSEKKSLEEQISDIALERFYSFARTYFSTDRQM